MPTSSQSQILSVVDYQLLQQQQQQQPNGQTTTTIKPPVRISVNQPSTANDSKRRQQKDNRRPSTDMKTDEDIHSSSLSSHVINRRRSSDKTIDNSQSARIPQRNDILRMPVINLNNTTQNDSRLKLNIININETRPSDRYGQTKTSVIDSSMHSFQNQQNSDNDDQMETQYKTKLTKKYPTPRSAEDNTPTTSDVDDIDDETDDNLKRERRSSLLNENARRLLVLGTIRPSRTFYKNLPEADVNHLMEYFRRMKQTQRKISSEEINQELATKYVEYKPKIFFDSACVTKGQVTQIEKIIEQYADKIRSQKAEFVKLDNPMRFVIKPIDNDTPLTTIPREYNDCFITLVTRSDPLRKSELVNNLVQEKFLEDVKANSLDISYFPGGVNYDVPREDIDEHGQMNVETYQKLKKRLNNRKVWHFSDPPEKKPNAILAILPTDSSINIDHQRLIDALYEHLKNSITDENTPIEQKILSIEFIPLSCILNSHDIPNQFIIDCDTNETKRQLMDKPLKITSNKHSITIELNSYDESMQREYEKFIKSEKYRELIKNHDAAVKRTSSNK